MAWSGSGTFSRVFGASGWTNDKNNGVKILASRHDTNDQDLADGINACLTRNNESKPTSDFLPAADNTLNLGSVSFRWALLNGQAPALLAQANTFLLNANSAQGQIVKNSSTGVSASSFISIINSADQLVLALTSTLFSGAFISGGPTGESGNFYTNANIPISIGTNNTERIRIAGDGSLINLQALQLRANGIHNGTAPSGSANQYLASGTYTPTITNSTNVTSSTARLCQWLRVGNVVTVSGSVNITETTGASVTAFDISLPIASNIGGTFELAGFVAGDLVTTGRGGPVVGNTAQDRAAAKYLAQNTNATAEEVSFHFSYLVT